MSEKNIVLIPGDGIGTEIIAAAKAVCDVAFEKARVFSHRMHGRGG